MFQINWKIKSLLYNIFSFFKLKKTFYLTQKYITKRSQVNICSINKIWTYHSDAIESKLASQDVDWLKRKLKVAEIGSNFEVSKMTKIVAGKKLWNYDQLEPTEKKGAI